MLKNLKIRRATFKRANIKTFGFFLLFSAVVWVLLQLSKDYTQIIEIPLEYENAPLDKSISKERPFAIEARMEDRGFNILYYQLIKPSLKVNLENTQIDGNRLIYVIENNQEEIADQLDFDFDKVRFLAEEIIINFQPRKKKKLKVNPEINLSYAVGYSANKGVVLTPDSVTVTGPEGVIDSIFEVSTVPLSINNISNDISGSVDIDTTGLGDISFYRTKVNYDLDVDKFTEGNVKVPVQVRNVPANINLAIFPKEVLVYYQVNLQQYDMIKDSDFVVVCDYNDIQSGDDYLIAEISKSPEFVNNIRISERKIQFVIKR